MSSLHRRVEKIEEERPAGGTGRATAGLHPLDYRGARCLSEKARREILQAYGVQGAVHFFLLSEGPPAPGETVLHSTLNTGHEPDAAGAPVVEGMELSDVDRWRRKWLRYEVERARVMPASSLSRDEFLEGADALEEIAGHLPFDPLALGEWYCTLGELPDLSSPDLSFTPADLPAPPPGNWAEHREETERLTRVAADWGTRKVTDWHADYDGALCRSRAVRVACELAGEAAAVEAVQRTG